MSLWEKITKDLQHGAVTFSEKASDWIKSSAEVLRDGVEVASQKTAYASKLAQLKWEQNMLHREIEKCFTALGGLVYELHTDGKLQEIETAAKEKLETLKGLETQLEKKEKEIENLPGSISSEDAAQKVLSEWHKSLNTSGGAVKQVILTASSPLLGVKLKDADLPQNLLVGTILRGEQVIIPDGNTEFQTGDKMMIVGKSEAIEEVMKTLSAIETESEEAKN